MEQSTLWLQYLKEMSSVVKLSAGEALQVSYPYVSWDWGGKNPVFGSYSYEQWATLNVVPSDPELNNNSNAAASQSGFDNAYQAWFNALAIGNLSTDKHYQELQTQLTAAMSQYEQDYANIKNVWLNQTSGSGPTLSAWLAEPGQFGYQTTISNDQSNVLAAQKQINTYRAQITQPLEPMVNAFANTKYMTNVTEPNSGASLQVRMWGTAPYANPWAYIEEVVGQFGTDAAHGEPREFSVSSSSETYNYSEFYGSGGTGAWDDFIGFEAEGSYQKIDWSQFSSSYNLKFSFQDLKEVIVTPGGWFSGSYFGTFGNGPYANGFSAYASGNNNYFFGPGGALSRIYSGLIVAYRPEVTIEASESFSSYLLEKWKAEGGLEIGPFFFGAETSGEKTSSTASQEGAKLVLRSKADWPVIIGMKSSWTKPLQSGSTLPAARAAGAATNALRPPAGGPFFDAAAAASLHLGAVQNLASGAFMEVGAGAIPGVAHMYRTGQGFPNPGNVGWVPNGGEAQVQPLSVGETATFAINGAAGMLVNGCPSMVQVLY
ncbi:MAG TPA: hypothetical protein VGF95_15270 [Solirubrobacteraceae bacterium]|jgi:hypothetical protein